MKKKDLNSGMIVEYRNGNLGLLVITRFGMLIQVSNDSWGELSDLEEDLTYANNHEYDIIKVRAINFKMGILKRYWADAEIVWEREEVPELTMEEAIKKIGFEFKIKK